MWKSLRNSAFPTPWTRLEPDARVIAPFLVQYPHQTIAILRTMTPAMARLRGTCKLSTISAFFRLDAQKGLKTKGNESKTQ
jgi:hypothetical protein